MTSTPLLSEADYEAIEAAVMETARGRWFVAEYARRNRHADTTMLLAALDRIEATIRGKGSVHSIDHVRFDLVEMAKAISRTKAEIASIKTDTEQHGKCGEATDELDSIVLATETATSHILAAAEQIQEIAWTLREQGLDSKVCDLLDSKATDVYTACSFQDLTGQRTRKVTEALGYLETRINAIIAIWGLDGAMAAEAAEAKQALTGDVALLNGPALPGRGLDQAGIDLVMSPAEATSPPTAPKIPPAVPARRAAERKIVREPAMADAGPRVPAAAALQPATEHRARLPAATVEPARHALSKSEADAFLAMPRAGLGPMAQAMVAPSDPLAAVMALSYEEKIALFS
jgi:chemotaxis regulatin CheY-phosphate phosphatase CheZ